MLFGLCLASTRLPDSIVLAPASSNSTPPAMPPRRPSKKPATVSPEPRARDRVPSGSKRKRAEAAIVEEQPEPAVAAPQRRSSKAPVSTTSRTAARTPAAHPPRTPSPAETDNSDHPAVKRPRTSPAGQDSDEEEYVSAPEDLPSEEEVVKPARAQKRSSRPPSSKRSQAPASRTSRLKKAETLHEEQEDEEQEEEAEGSRPQAPSPSTSKAPPSAQHATPSRAKPAEDQSTPRAKSTSKATKTPVRPADDEEEQSLLDLPEVSSAMRRLSGLPPPSAVEEPQGPKSRLVIHKMVLNNFKSYAGRQVIGPFHKVRHSFFRSCTSMILIICIVLLGDCGT